MGSSTLFVLRTFLALYTIAESTSATVYVDDDCSSVLFIGMPQGSQLDSELNVLPKLFVCQEMQIQMLLCLL